MSTKVLNATKNLTKMLVRIIYWIQHVGSFGDIPKSNFSRIGKNYENRLSFLEDIC